LSNWDATSSYLATFNGRTYVLPPWSVSILPDCTNVAFNTAQVSESGSGGKASLEAVITPFQSVQQTGSAALGRTETPLVPQSSQAKQQGVCFNSTSKKK
jgi:hypothetical protein